MKIAARPRERELRRSYDLIAGRLAEVENELMRLCDSPVTTISKIGDYLRSGGGKRIVWTRSETRGHRLQARCD